MIPNPTNPTGSPKATTSRRLDPQPLTGPQATARLRRQRLAVEQVAARGAVRSPRAAARRVPPALGEQRERHLGACLELAHDAVAAAVATRAARAAPHRVARDAQRELELERLDGRVERVRHSDV